MNAQFDNQMNRIREGWSEEERENRKQLAGAMQLQLRQLVELSELSAPSEIGQETPVAMASAC